MNNKGDEMDTDLSALWQTQPVSKIDVEAVKRNFNNERKKQRLYIVVDLLLLIPAILIVFSTWGEHTYAMKVLCVSLFVVSTPFILYQLWLRRVAAFAKESQTVNHLEKLIQQTKNNIRIAFLTKHSIWPTLLIIPAFVYLRFQKGDVSPESFQRIVFALAVSGTVIVIWCIWAHKRQQRFERQLQTLIEMEESRGS